MNKIYELAEEAAEHAVLNPGNKMLRSETEDYSVEIPKAFIDKFAEMMVEECVQVCLAQRDPYNLNYKPSERFAEAVKLHFGVEHV